MVGKTFSPNLYLAQSVYATGRSVGGFNGRFAWLNVMFEQQLCYGVPGPAQCEVIVPVEVDLVESYLVGFLDEAVHVFRCSVQH
jgi:hypothetical protein